MDKYVFINDILRRIYVGMVDIMDEVVGNIIDVFKEVGYFNNNS